MTLNLCRAIFRKDQFLFVRRGLLSSCLIGQSMLVGQVEVEDCAGGNCNHAQRLLHLHTRTRRRRKSSEKKAATQPAAISTGKPN